MLTLSATVWLLTVAACVSAWRVQVFQEFPGVGTFQFVGDSLPWPDAFTHCKGINGSLAVAQSLAEAEVIQNMMIDNEVESIHIGFEDIHLEGVYYTVLGTPVETECANKWAPGAPFGGDDKNCGSLTTEGLTDADCSIALPFVCKLHTWESYGYEDLGVGWYKYHANKTTWVEAREKCHSEGAHLLIVNSEEELTILHDRYQYTWAWAGAHHRYANQQFITIFGQPLETTGFTRWRLGDPAGNNIDHPYLALQSTDGLYTSRGDTHRDFICEHEFTA